MQSSIIANHYNVKTTELAETAIKIHIAHPTSNASTVTVNKKSNNTNQPNIALSVQQRC